MKVKASTKICHCSILHKLDDSRIFYKECISLVKVGYSVTYIAKPVDNLKFHEPSYIGVNLQKLKSNNRIYNNFYLFITIIRQNMKIVHFHDPELIVMGLFLKLFGKKVIYDAHENVRQDILHKIWILPVLRHFLSKTAIFFEFMANKFFNGIVSATPTIYKNFNNKNNYVIRNLPHLQNREIHVETKRYKNVIIYIGTLSEARGIKELISAAAILSGVAELWLLGVWTDDTFKMECEKMDGFNNTKYLGMVSHEEVSNILNKATIGLCTLHPIDTFKDSYPIKVFEYMQNGLPVLMSNFEMWQELFGDLCEYIDPMDHFKIADKIKSMLDNPSRLDDMSFKGKVVINEQFNWETESRNLEELYSKI